MNENFFDENEENTDIDQVVTDLAILEHQLINSVTQRKEPLFIRPDLKDSIISDLDHYFEDKSSALNEEYKSETSTEQNTVEHLPHISTYNLTSIDTHIIIENLKHAQMYMFQVYACHDISKQSKSKACSTNGIIITVRTKPGDRTYILIIFHFQYLLLFGFVLFCSALFLASLDIVHNVTLDALIDKSLSASADMKTVNYHISWLEPLSPNGLVYFYMIYIEQYTQMGPKDERCVGYDIHSVNVSLLPRTNYRLRIATYTISRLNLEYEANQQLKDDSYLLNATNLYYQIFFTTIDLPSKRNMFIVKVIDEDKLTEQHNFKSSEIVDVAVFEIRRNFNSSIILL